MSRFDTVPIRKPGRNVFDLSHDVKASYKFDWVYPFLCEEIVPGDTWNCRAEVFMRSMPLLVPVMHNVDMFIWYVFVPNRLAWNEKRKDDWKIFITGGEDGQQTPVKPYFTWKGLKTLHSTAMQYGRTMAQVLADCRPGGLMDHIGMPCLNSTATVPGTSEEKIDAIPLRCYQIAWNELFRNENVQNEIEFSYDSGEVSTLDLSKLIQLRRKNLEKDYFTSCLPWQQRGTPQPLPLDMSQATLGFDALNQYLDIRVNGSGSIESTSLDDGANDYGIRINADGSLSAQQYDGGAVANDVSVYSGQNKVTLDFETIANRLSLSGVSVGTISDLRSAYRIQMWLENNARCGSRYIEQILAHFGVMSSDARLQRPELLGGGKIPLIFTDVEQMSGTVDNADYPTVQGNLAGKGTLYGKTGGFKKSFEEHGWLFGLLSIVPRTSYQQGLPRKFTRMNKLDYYFPEFANLSEQAVLRKEIYFAANMADSATETYNEVFGYQERFCEMRYIPSSVHGQMIDTLQSWHLGRKFTAQQYLNSDFVESNTRANIFALDDVQQGSADPFVCQIHNDIKAVRPLPKHAIPSL